MRKELTSLDLSGLNCPLPVLKTKKKLSSMDTGERLFVVCTDQGSFDDFKYFCDHSGNKLVSRERTEDKIFFLLSGNSSLFYICCNSEGI